MIVRDQLSEKFCNLELEKIKQQELLFAKSKQNHGGSSGTPIEENKTSAEMFKAYDQKQKALHQSTFSNSTSINEANIEQKHEKKQEMSI
jgi:hypothetical protein